jgi:hypothetical protein
VKIYAGIGSRKTPPDVMDLMAALGAKLAMPPHGWTLRSGGAEGADSAFERGCDSRQGVKEVWLPWRGFGGRTGPGVQALDDVPFDVVTTASEIAASVHPVWSNLTQGVKKLHTRNVFQVLGANLNTPVKLVLCWTPGARVIGGTATAIHIAESRGIPVVNMASADWQARFQIAAR